MLLCVNRNRQIGGREKIEEELSPTETQEYKN